MVDEEDYFMIRDRAREQQHVTGRVNISELSRETGFDRKTIRHHLSSDAPPITARTRNRSSKLDPYKPYILGRLEKYPRLSRVRLLDEIQSLGFDGKTTILGDYLRQIRPKIPVLPEIRYETLPGEMTQCDWSDCIYSCTDGSEKKVDCFSMILGYSRVRYVEFTQTQDLPTFLACHLRAFEYFNGVTRTILYDNLGSVVLKRKYPSTASDFHPSFVDLRDHFGFIARLCRINRAKTKGKVERTIGYVKDNFLYGREFNSFNDLNIQAQTWMKQVNSKVHGTTNEIPFDRLPQEKLRPYSSYTTYLFKKRYSRKVSRDCYISLYQNYYSVPWQYAGRMVDVTECNSTVVVSADSTDICTHNLLEGKNQRSKKNEHFEGLLKKIRDEPCTGSKRKRKEQPCTNDTYLVQQRALCSYDALCEEEKQ